VNDFGAQAGEQGSDLQRRARQNTLAINQAIAAAKAAGSGTIVFPGRYYPVTAAAPLREGLLARHGPVSRAIQIVDCRDLVLTASGSETRLARLESEVTGQYLDASNATLAINSSHNIRVEGLQFEGQQSSDVKQYTTGDSIQINFGSQDIQILHVSIDKGTNGISVGANRTEYGSHNRGLSRPVRNIEIRDIDVFNCEHAILVNVAEDVVLDGIRHSARAYQYRGESQALYVQRGVYLLNCRKVVLRNAKLLDASKVAVFMALYPQRRAFSDLEDITIEKVEIASRYSHPRDWEIGLQIFDQNQDNAARTTARRLRLQDITVSKMKTTLSMRSRPGGLAEAPAVNGMRISGIHSQTFRSGVEVDRNFAFAELSLTNSTFDMQPKTPLGGLVGLSFNATGNGQQTSLSRDLVLEDLQVRARAQAVTIGPVKSVSLARCYFEDQRPRPSQEREDLRLEGATQVSERDVTRAGASAAATPQEEKPAAR
jgi:hypothetical protein